MNYANDEFKDKHQKPHPEQIDTNQMILDKYLNWIIKTSSIQAHDHFMKYYNQYVEEIYIIDLDTFTKPFGFIENNILFSNIRIQDFVCKLQFMIVIQLI